MTTQMIIAQCLMVMTLIIMITGKTPLYLTAIVGAAVSAIVAGYPIAGSAPMTPEFPIYLYIAGFRRQFSSPSRSKTSLWRPKISPSQTFPVDEL